MKIKELYNEDYQRINKDFDKQKGDNYKQLFQNELDKKNKKIQTSEQLKLIF